MPLKKDWIGVDLDGTLAVYDKWQGEDHIGEPVPAMIERVKRWLEAGEDVRIFTARVSVPSPAVEAAIRRWSRKHIGRALPVTCTKDFECKEIWDDRAVQIEKNTGKPVGYSTRGLS